MEEINSEKLDRLVVGDTVQIRTRSTGRLIREDHTKSEAIWLYEGEKDAERVVRCLLYTSPSPRDIGPSRMPSSA